MIYSPAWSGSRIYFGGKSIAGKKARARIASAKQLERDVHRYRLLVGTFKEIAQKCGVTVSAAWKAFQRAMEGVNKQNTLLASHSRNLRIERFEAINKAFFRSAMKGDHASADRVVRVNIEVAKLFGEYAPERHELTGADGAPLERGQIVIGCSSDVASDQVQ